MSKNLDISAELALAVAKYRARQFEEATVISEGVLAAQPMQADAVNILALISRETKKWGRAEQLAKQGIASNPNSAALRNTLGLVLLDQGRLEEAHKAFQEATKLKPDLLEFKINLGRVLHELGQLENAFDALTEVIERHPFAQAHILRAAVSAERGDLKAAKQDIDAAGSLNANDTDLAMASALCAFVEGDLDAAYSYFDTATQNTVNVADAQVNRGMVRLLQGRIKEGWTDYNLRHKRRWARTVKRSFPYSEWEGEDLAGKMLLVWGEQGLGESILCSSLIPHVVEEAKHVILECDPRLTSLFQQSFPSVEVLPQKTPADPAIGQAQIDCQASMLELIVHRAGDLEGKGQKGGYLKADQEQTDLLRSKYKKTANDRPLIGLSWGSPKAANARIKTLDLAVWHPLLSVPGVTFVNLQYGADRGAMDDLAAQTGASMITDSGIDPDGDLDAAACQIAAMDLVITVSSTPAHLAGALGKETWAIIPPIGPAGMWYWFTDREDSPWYPHVRLFRRQYGESRDIELLQDIAAHLTRWKQ